MVDHLWYKNAIIYEVYVRAFNDSNADGHGDLRGLIQKLDYLKELGVDCLWLLPIYPSPLLDDGYDIADYYGIHPDYGSLQDFKDLVAAVHARGMRLITDLVLNHTSDQHPWFQAARVDGDSPFRDYYVWSDNNQKYKDTRIIFLDTEESNWTWDEVAGQYFWHRFYSSQPDLNYDNLAVRLEIQKVMKFWLDLGVDGFRADAVPYLFEREGTNCENLPETHDYLKEVRMFMDENYPGRILLCEANQWPEDVRSYFGEGDEFHLGFHFPVMPRIFMALRKGDISPLVWILERTPPIPESCQWCTFLRNHDELTLEMVTEEERQWMWQEYAPEARMRLNLGIRRRLAPLLDNDQRLIELANSLLFTLPGAPVLYYGDEIGMGDDIWLPDRNGVRTPMQWNDDLNAGFSNAPPEQLYTPVLKQAPYDPRNVSVAGESNDPDSLFHRIRQMIKIRKATPALARGDFSWVSAGTTKIAAFLRSYQGIRILAVHNLTDEPQSVDLEVPETQSGEIMELITGNEVQQSDNGKLALTLRAYQFMWLKL